MEQPIEIITTFVMHEITNSNGSNCLKNIGRQRGESTQVFSNFKFVSSCSDRPFYSPSKFNVMHGLKRRNKFTIAPSEIAYWSKIHKLNEAEKPKVTKPTHVQEYLKQYVNLIAEGVL